jgi:hypothetical protein
MSGDTGKGDGLLSYCVIYRVRLRDGAPLVNIVQMVRAACAADARAAYVAEQREVHGRDVSEEDFVSCRLMKQPKRGDLAANCLTESQS